MRRSIKKQIALIFIGLMTCTLLACWFINNAFLVNYYLVNKERTLMKAYNRINEASSDNRMDSDEFDIEFEKMYSTDNIAIVIMDPSGTIKKSSISQGEILTRQLYGYIVGNLDVEVEVLENSENYIVQKVTDPRSGSDYMEIWGALDNGNLFIMRTAIESIRDSVSISNRFLAYTGFFAIFVSAAVIWFVTRRITEPILELAKISERMTHLDFEARYESREENEIGLLGTHINQLSDALEKTISELKTANNELQRDIENKIKIDEMRKEFLSNVSHELKTPIALIQGYAEGLKEGINDDAESREFYCEVIMDEASKMNQMVKKLLTLNQLEFGNEKIVMERFDIASLIKNIIQSSDILIRQKGAKVIFKADAPVYVWADEFKIEEVVTNYITNALNHVDHEMLIEVKITETEKNARISVFNTGKTIPEEDIDNIWGKFYKIDKARTREYGGSGIGLSIVKAIMESLNKGYGVKNYENGVEFWFELDK
ncbi:sensor histidine kinase [Anaerobium acetethylicum]|uniref:histidine kinase n=1 Tax=Anaerobium acetethylicum TaxID=1619234 RepID=A0A1D3TVH5_9FIRM|nr:HAMP domain-containing sensor histidine kinase [Anaerobium acetethylicum]SCP98120.1 Signal transduction histidine kinase [Anaerobium acetethylicum]